MFDIYELEWKRFPLVLEPIIIPQNVIIHLGNNPLTNNITFFNSNRNNDSFITKKPIKLYDIRYIRMLLKEMLNYHPPYNKELLEAFYVLTISLGLCSFNKQIELIKKEYSEIKKFKTLLNETSIDKFPKKFNFIELDGIRFGETNNDQKCFSILQGIFENEVDGIIYPQMSFPLSKKHSEEIILFNPYHSLIPTVKQNNFLDINTLISAKKNNTLKYNLPFFKVNNEIINFDIKSYNIGCLLQKQLNVRDKNESTIKTEKENKFRMKNHLNPCLVTVPWNYREL